VITLGTIGAFGFADFDPPEIIGLYRQLGATVVQAYRRRDSDITPAHIRAVCDDLGMGVDSMHGLFGEDLDPSSEDEAVRRRTIEVYRSEVAWIHALGGEMIVVHPAATEQPTASIEGRWTQLRRSFEDLAVIGQREQVVYAFENMPHEAQLGDDLPRLVDEVKRFGDPHVTFCLDTGHAHMTGDLCAAARLAGPILGHVHCSDNDGVADQHLLPFHGTAPWERMGEALAEIGFSDTFLLEVFEPADALRQAVAEGWRERFAAALRIGGAA